MKQQKQIKATQYNNGEPVLNKAKVEYVTFTKVIKNDGTEIDLTSLTDKKNPVESDNNKEKT